MFLVAYTIYAASSVKACGTLFHTVIGMDPQIAMYLAAVVIVGYTFLGGFSAVCWTDFFQGMLVLGSMFIAPIFAAFMLDTSSMSSLPGGYLNPFSSWQDIVSGLAWGLGYFGMPHIIIRFMSIKSQKDLKKSAKIGITWTLLIVFFATLIGVIGRLFLGFDESINENSLVFILQEIFNQWTSVMHKCPFSNPWTNKPNLIRVVLIKNLLKFQFKRQRVIKSLFMQSFFIRR